MKLSTQTHLMAETFGAEGAIRYLAKAGYDCIDWSFFEMTEGKGLFMKSNYKTTARKLRALADECGIEVNQAHAPFPSSRGEEPFDTQITERIIRSMEVASILGAKQIIVHPKQHFDYVTNKQKMWDLNVEWYRSLIPFCEAYQIRVCVENMWQFDDHRKVIADSFCSQPEEFAAFLDTVDSPWIVGCLDIGHCALVGVDPAHFIVSLGRTRLQALHVHDVDYVKDRHTLPYTESLDWTAIIKALVKIGYEGEFTFEADQFLAKLPVPLRLDACFYMQKVGRYLAGELQSGLNKKKGPRKK